MEIAVLIGMSIIGVTLVVWSWFAVREMRRQLDQEGNYLTDWEDTK